jgi:hypothetical protein
MNSPGSDAHRPRSAYPPCVLPESPCPGPRTLPAGIRTTALESHFHAPTRGRTRRYLVGARNARGAAVFSAAATSRQDNARPRRTSDLLPGRQEVVGADSSCEDGVARRTWALKRERAGRATAAESVETSKLDRTATAHGQAYFGAPPSLIAHSAALKCSITRRAYQSGQASSGFVSL